MFLAYLLNNSCERQTKITRSPSSQRESSSEDHEWFLYDILGFMWHKNHRRVTLYWHRRVTEADTSEQSTLKNQHWYILAVFDVGWLGDRAYFWIIRVQTLSLHEFLGYSVLHICISKDFRSICPHQHHSMDEWTVLSSYTNGSPFKKLPKWPFETAIHFCNWKPFDEHRRGRRRGKYRCFSDTSEYQEIQAKLYRKIKIIKLRLQNIKCF